jgi:hypothetical protein
MEPLAPDPVGARANSRPQNSSIVRVQNAGTAKTAASGVSFFARALAPDTGGRWFFLAEGRTTAGLPARFAAEAPAGLRAGDRVRVFTAAPSGRGVLYRVLLEPTGPAPGLLSSLGLPEQPAVLALVSAFRFLGLPLEPRRIRRLFDKLSRLEKDGPLPSAAALVAAAADDKGFDATAEAVQAASGLIDPHSGKHGGGRERRERSERGKPDAEGLKKAASEFRSAGNPLSFMNDADGRSGKRWLAFPINFTNSSVEIRATVSLLLNPKDKDPSSRVEFCSIDVSAPSRFWSVRIARGDAGHTTATVLADPSLEPAMEPSLVELSEGFTALGLRVFFSSDRAGQGLAPMDLYGFAPVREEA